MKLITHKTVTMLGDLIEPQMDLFLTATSPAVRLGAHYGAVIEFLHPKKGSPFQSRPLPVVRVDLENATQRMPLHQFGLN